MHIEIEPSILYFGTPVLLLTTQNPDGTTSVAPISSAWWLGWNCMLGLGAEGHTAANLQRERECVLNLPSADMAGTVDRLALLTGSDPVPAHKLAMGYRHEKHKLSIAGLTAEPSAIVRAPRIAECPVQLEAVVEAVHEFGRRPDKPTGALAFEVRIVRAHIDANLIKPGTTNHIDPDLWRPLIMSFGQFYGLGQRTGVSKLADVPEESYCPAPKM